jgi:O-succinylbenzoic acid--CoA ligase
VSEPLSLLAAAREAAPGPALIVDGQPVGWNELAAQVTGVIRWLLSRGIFREDPGRVAVVATSDRATLALLYALFELGVTVVLIHPRLTPTEHEFIIADSAPKLVIRDPSADVQPEPVSELDPPLPPVPADRRTMAMIYTSGTSGRPKGAMLSRAAFVAASQASEANLGWRPDDRWLLCMPVAHVGGLSIVVRCLTGRRCVVVSTARFDPVELAALMRRDAVTIASLVPTMLIRMLDAGASPAEGVRAILLGGAAPPPSLLDRARARGIPVLTTYGLTEACAQATTQRYGTPPGEDQGAGVPLLGNEVKIVNGEILVRGPALMSGYFPPGVHPSPFTEEGWLRTGDLGWLDAEGRLHIDARRSDLIVTGGENVYPSEVEAAVGAHPLVKDVAVVGLPDAKWGERVHAAVVLHEGASLSEAELLEWCKERLAGYKRPRTCSFLRDEEMPRNATGKILHRVLKTKLTS